MTWWHVLLGYLVFLCLFLRWWHCAIRAGKKQQREIEEWIAHETEVTSEEGSNE